MIRRLRDLDIDAIAGVIVAIVALALHLLGIANQETILAIVLVVLALLLVRDLRSENRDERVERLVEATANQVSTLGASISPPDAILVGPRQLRQASEAFARRAKGEMVWFNVCLLMFRPQSLFDTLLAPAIENRSVTAIQFVLDEGERDHWREDVMPKVQLLPGAAKVREPRWCALDESVSFVLSDMVDDGLEAHLSFWGEPFMARHTGQDVPRYIFHVQQHSELILQLVEMDRRYRLRH